MTDIQDEKLIEIYTNMTLTRAFENAVADLFADETMAMHGTTHLYIGQEAVASGVCAALRPGDRVMSNHRGHGHAICMGISVESMFAELLGRESGCCKGKSGSMHIFDVSRGYLGSTGIVGGGLPISVGSALASKMRGEDAITVCFFGDGAANEGTFHESLNMTSVLKLPVIFVCENNQYAMSTPVKHHMNANIVSRAAGYGIKGMAVDGNDAVNVYQAACEAREYALANDPVLLVCDTYRTYGHSRSDTDDSVYRSRDEVEKWLKRDPIDIMKDLLLKNGIASEQRLLDTQHDTALKIEQALENAKGFSYPNAKELYTEVYA